MTIRDAVLILADGTVFEGEAIGVDRAVTTGEVVFNTVLGGYQEVLSDPSYAGQIVTFTYPHIGNHGTNDYDNEAASPACRGVIIRDLARRDSNWRSEATLDSWLVSNNLSGIAGIDTRKLTIALRDTGAIPAAFGTANESELLAAAKAASGTDGCDYVKAVTCNEMWRPDRTKLGVGEAKHDLRVVAYDFGIKRTILRKLLEIASDVVVVPATATADEVMAIAPQGVFLSNGPGDPAAVSYGVAATKALLGQVPVFGICLGHQLLGTALGGTTYKLKFGHHGGNHPVRDIETGHVAITSQNHNYCVDPNSLGDNVKITQINLNDETVEGLMSTDVPAFSVQYHPEAGPGPHDASWLFDSFADLAMKGA